MNDNLQQKLIEWAEKIGDIASEQLPEFASQIVAYTAWTASIWMYVGMAFSSVLILFLIICFVSLIHSKGQEREAAVFCGGLALMLLTLPVGVIAHHYVIIKKCELAPKLVVIEKLRGK